MLKEKPKYSTGQKVFVDGEEYEVNYPVFMEQHNAITGERTPIGWYYRLCGYPQDVSEDKITITPEEFFKYKSLW